ncbi:transmembrane protein FAM155A [Electrophorus electricus]|uniref:transmembrane protein FAM155A n=1 Tax=Electrophorus electricus TaxID=8005 RepID=UPI000F0A3A7A|nr:transmembrane protein FAM155A [Electrophorus electricus]
MTSGAWKCRQRDDGLKIWFAPRENEKPFTDSERAQRWRLSLASLLFLTVLLSDHLWFCAEAKSTGTRDKEPDKLASVDTGAYPSVNPKPNLPPANSSLRRNEDAIFIENSTKPTWSLETCHADSLSKNCFTFVNADHLCTGLSETNGTRSVDLKDLYLSFCNSYSLMDLFNGSSPDNLTCSLDVIMNDLSRCSQCVQAYQRYDLHAQEKYEEFEIMTERYETDVYSVRTCMDECRMVYKPWLCAQYFQGSQSNCSHRVSCERYCLEVQQKCPFILPDNDDLIHGGTPSFICTGLPEKPNAEEEQCCDVRWELKTNNRLRGTFRRTHPSCQHTSMSASGAPRLGQGRLKLCLLVLVLLHTVATMTANQNSTCLATIFPLEDNAPREE